MTLLAPFQSDDSWVRRGAHWWQNAAGYRVAAALVGGAWRYSLFTPPAYGAHDEFAATLKTQYACGECVPQTRELLGCFDDPGLARAAATDHAQPAKSAQ